MAAKSRLVVFLSLCLLIPILTQAQSAEQTGEIFGKVLDEGGEGLPGVGITARTPKLQGTRTALSDKEGHFKLPLLPVGEYSLAYELSGFEKLTTLQNTVRLGATLSVSVTLKVSSLSEEVSVIAENPLIDRKNADNSYRLTSDDLTKIPTQARTIAEVVSYTPGVTGVRTDTVTGTDTGSPGFRGEGDAGNNWFVDGISVRGSTYYDSGIRTGFDVWEEVQIVSDGFAPELGQAMGGYVNIVTKSGGNEFHGELGTLIRGSNLRAKRQDQLSAATLPETSVSDFFANLGGPILKDRLWFFLSDNFHRISDVTQEQAVGWLTIPGGKRRVDSDGFFGKVTYTPQKNHTFSMSAVLDAFLGQKGGIGLPETYSKETHTDCAYLFNYRGILSQNTLLTARAGRFIRSYTITPLGDDFGTPSYYWMDIGQTTNNAYGSYDEREHKTELALQLIQYLSLGSWGEHEISVGLSYNESRRDFTDNFSGQGFDPWPGNGFDNGIQFTWEAPGVPAYLDEYGPCGAVNSQHGFGFYVGDTFSIGRFSLMLGLRAETQKVFNSLGEPIWSWGLGDFLTPRASLAVDLFGDGKNIFKLGFGRFAQPHSLMFLGFFNTEKQYTFRGYSWVGGLDPTEAELRNPANWEFYYEQSGAANPIGVDPEIKPNMATKFLAEFDRQLGRDWVLKVRGVYSYARNLPDMINVYDPVLHVENLIYTNFDLKRRDYKALEVEINGRAGKLFTLNASYTLSQAKGTNPGNYFEALSWNTEWGFPFEGSNFGSHPDVPEGDPNKEFLDELYHGLGGPGAVGDEGWYGFLPYSVDHVIKILGVYSAPYGVLVSSGIEYLSGYHWEKKGWSEAGGAYVTFPEGRGSRTTPGHMYADLAVEKQFFLGERFRLNLGMNFYNILNSQRPVSYVQEDSTLFGQVWGRQLPRWMQFKATLRF